jgi:hypothetical protein
MRPGFATFCRQLIRFVFGVESKRGETTHEFEMLI